MIPEASRTEGMDFLEASKQIGHVQGGQENLTYDSAAWTWMPGEVDVLRDVR